MKKREAIAFSLIFLFPLLSTQSKVSVFPDRGYVFFPTRILKSIEFEFRPSFLTFGTKRPTTGETEVSIYTSDFSISASELNSNYPEPECSFGSDVVSGSWASCSSFSLAPSSDTYIPNSVIPSEKPTWWPLRPFGFILMTFSFWFFPVSAMLLQPLNIFALKPFLLSF